jgi:uncharacterized protein YbjT (DUF2867 family)
LSTTRTAVAICGSDQWLRHHVSQRLNTDFDVRDVGSGTSYLNGIDVLVIVPHLSPQSGSGTRDVAMQQALHNINAAHAFSVGRVVLVSRVGAGSSDDPYLVALGALERSASASFKKLTIVRLAHPFGPPEDPGPFMQALAALNGGMRSPDTPIQPLYRDDAVAAIAAAVAGRFGAGVVEVGGPETLRLWELAAHASVGTATSAKPAGVRRLFNRRGRANAVEGFMAMESIPQREYVPAEPRATHRISEVWAED